MSKVELLVFICFFIFSSSSSSSQCGENIYNLPGGIPPNNHGIPPIVLIKEEIAIVKNNLLTIVPRLSTEWSVSFEFRHTSLTPVWTNIIQFTTSDDSNSRINGTEFGDRTPAVFVKPGSTIFYFASAVNGKSDYNVERLFKPKEKSHIEIHQRYVSRGDYRYFIKVDGIEVHSVINTDARQFYNVKVYASNPWYDEANGFISNFQLTNFL